MNHSEYLRRKMKAAPQVLGAARPGDASETTRMRTAIAAAGGRQRAAPRTALCCGPRTKTTVLPSGVVHYHSPPIRMGPGCGLSEDRTASRTTLVAAGCALIGAAAAGWDTTEGPVVTRMAGCIPTGEIHRACCPQESTPERPTDPTKKALAYQGRVGCCGYQGLPLQALDPATLNHCCRVPGNIDTVTMTDVPGRLLPLVPAYGPSCCPAPAPASEC
jgi:hypothetical protein